MSAPEARRKTAALALADFGLSTARLHIDPNAAPDELLFDALCLLKSGLSVFESLTEAGLEEREGLQWSGIYMLRQAAAVLDAAQLTPAQGAAVMAARLTQ